MAVILPLRIPGLTLREPLKIASDAMRKRYGIDLIEPQQVTSVRLPVSVHAELRHLAAARNEYLTQVIYAAVTAYLAEQRAPARSAA